MSDRNVTPNTATSSRDRLQEIRARLDLAGTWSADGPDNAHFVKHAPSDIAWLLRQLENERADNALHEDDIHDLRDQVNALWDIVAEQDVPNVLGVYAERLEAQRVMRRGRIAAHGDPMTNYWGGWRAGNVTIEEVTDA